MNDINDSFAGSADGISMDDAYQATGITPSNDGAAALFGVLLCAIRFFNGVQWEVGNLLREREMLRGGFLDARQKSNRGLLQPDGTDRPGAVEQRVAEIDVAISFLYHEAQVITARSGFERSLAGTRWENGVPPTPAELEQFLLLRDPWTSSDKFPETIQEWGVALSLPQPTKETVLAEISRRTVERRIRVEKKHAADMAKLVAMTTARVSAFVAAEKEGRLPREGYRIMGSALSASWQVLFPGSGLLPLGAAQRPRPVASYRGELTGLDRALAAHQRNPSR